MARASRHPPAISRGDGPPGATGAPVTGEPGTLANWTIRSCPVSATQTCPVAAIARPCGNSRSSARPARVRLQAELGVEAPGRAEHGHQPVVRLRDVDPAVRPDRDAARVAEVTVARLGDAERAQLMPGRGELADRVAPGQGVAGAGHPDVAAGVQRDAGRRRHGERDAVAAVGGELHHPAVALVGDPDVAGGRDRERHRVVQPLPAAPGRRRRRPAPGRRRRTPPPGHGRCPPPRRARPRRRRPACWSRFLPKAASTRPAAENSTTRLWPVSATQTCPAGSTATPAGCASACCPSALANRGACASGSGRAGEPEATGTATSMAASTLPPAMAIARDRRPRHRDFRPLIDEQSNPFRPVAAKRSAPAGRPPR